MRGIVTFAVVFLAACAAHAEYRVATFEVDVTVPIGHALMGGGIAPAERIVDPLRAQGIVLTGGDAPIVWVSVDWCEIRNDAYDEWREALAEAAGTARERVLLAAIHQHDTPVVDFTAQRLLDEAGLAKSLCDTAFARECIGRTAAALREALPHSRAVTHYGVGVAEVKEIASNRRIVLENGAAAFHRASSAPDPAIRAHPAGTHDPFVRTLSFWDCDDAVAALSTYAVHPMSYYGRGGVSADFVGMARARMQGRLPGAKYLYFSGCSGDVVAGKWNDGSEEARQALAERLYAGMAAVWDNTARYPLEGVRFRLAELDLPLRETAGFTEADQRRILSDANERVFARNLAAMGLSWRLAKAKGRTIDVCGVDFGQAVFVLMPAESFVQYQIDAQAMRRDAAVLVAGYGESAPGYIPSASAIGEGFIDGHEWCWVGAAAPEAMGAALESVLGEEPGR